MPDLCLSSSLPAQPKELKEEIFKLLFESAEISTFTPTERIRYIEDMTTERDLKNQMAYAENKGKAEGLEQMAKALAQMGMSDADIKKALELAKNS